MAKYFQDNARSIGNTPMVRINRMAQATGALVLAKIEGRNPAYSVKCRIGAGMIRKAEQDRTLMPGMEIVEPTSGNTGIALAFVAASLGYRLHVTMPETMSLERRKVLAFFGANVILTPGSLGMRGAVEEAERIVASDRKYFMPQQFKNPANPQTHFETTGPEIWEQTSGGIDVLVCGVGTGGTISGVSRYIKKDRGKPILSVAVEPASSPVISQRLSGMQIRPGPHKIQGIGAGFIPDTLDLDLVDRVEKVTDEEAIEHSRRLAREEGILAGISSGAAMAAALRLARMDAFKGKTIVVVLPDSGERYLSSVLFEGV
ncbi:MAG TPA: cysteine synthase A [Deltaproteobacteria bacterium]|nr:cysteine synthase A [Deltaproteobacteria bacterium]HPP81696.1 cysteine synthase A [Deltaproteobacteria bacterium]